jgi:hypothetical protein
MMEAVVRREEGRPAWRSTRRGGGGRLAASSVRAAKNWQDSTAPDQILVARPSSLHRLARTGRILAKNDRTLPLCNLDRPYADLVRFNTSIVMPLSRITAIDATTVGFAFLEPNQYGQLS